MHLPLLYRLGWRPLLLLLALLAAAVRPAQATHLLGGELTYRYLDANGPALAPLRYEITVTIYNNCNIGVGGVAAPNTNADIAFFDQTTGAKLNLTTVNYPTVTDNQTQPAQTGIMNISSTSLTPTCISPTIPSGCTVTGVSQPFRLQKFIGIVNLPVSASGYYAVFTRSARNTDVTNLNAPGNQALSLYATIAPPLLFNRSPVFSDTAVAIICQGDTSILLNNAVDADGDRLVYSFGNPYGSFSTGNGILPTSFTPPPPLAPYKAGYTPATPFGTTGGAFASLNAATGIAKYRAATGSAGSKYVVAVDVSEYRTINGREVLIGTTRRDLQLVVGNCPSTLAPVLPPLTTTPRSYTIEEGSSLSIPLTGTQADNHPLTLTLNSVLLDGPGGFNTTFNGNAGTVVPGNPTGTATATGTGTVSGTFVYNSACGEARATPYDVAFTVKDNGCGGKIVADVLRITVTRPSGPTAISGDQTICALNSVHTYTASGGTAPSVRWRVVGGTVVGSNVGSSVQVRWATAGSGTVVAKGLSQYGCLTDSVAQTVAVVPAPALVLTGPLTICQGSSTTLVVTGGAPYTITGGATPLTGAGPFVLSPTQTTTYTITGAPTANGCTSTTQFTVTVVPVPLANVGAATRTTCSGVPITIGATAVTGNTYSWSPATGLSSPTVANPTVTLTNTTGGAITQTYTLTETSATGNCQATNSVVVTVNPVPVAVPGPAVAFCSGGSAQLGGPPVAGLTYSWSPATGLSSSTVANPIVTLTNTGATITQTYTLTVTNTATGCFSTGTVDVIVNPLPIAAPGPAVTICSGSSAQLGIAGVAGNTYSWSPATGLSNPTVANPTVTLTNTTGTPITQTYTLTVTTSATSCVSTATVVVTVNPAAIALAGPAQAVCSTQTITLGTAALPGYSYQWLPATNLSSATAAQPVLTGVNTTNAPIIQKYVVRATTAQGCFAKDSVLVTINPRPVADSIAGPTSVCPTVTGIVYSIRNPHATTYQWSITGGTITAGQGTSAITVNWGVAGTGSVSMYAFNAFGCNSPVTTIPVLINQRLQTVKPTGPTSVCQADGPYAYQTLAINGSSYSWQLFGTAQGTLVNTSNSTSISFTQAGLAKLVVTQTSNPSGGICRGVSDTLYITVKPSPATTLAIQGPARFCFNSGAITYTLPGAVGSTYVFQLNGNTIAGTGNSVAIPTTTAVGTYTLTAREINSGNCAGPLYTKQFIVDPRPGALVINGPRFVCPASGSLTYTVPNATASSTFQWTVTGGTITAGQGTASITVSFPTGTTTNKTVSVTEASSFGCTGTPVAITVVPDNAQAPTLTVASVEAQDNGKVDITFSVTNPQTTPNPVRVLRRPAGSTAAFAQVGTVAATATTYTDATADAAQNSYEYRLELTNGCGDTFGNAANATTVHLAAVATPGTGGRSQGSVQFSWNAYQGFVVGSYQVYQQNDNGSYTLATTVSGTTLQATITNGATNSGIGSGFNQCFRIVAVASGTPTLTSNSNTACVNFVNKLAFYNIITPNGDGQNDVLVIDNVTLYPGNSLSIFNRWGREVYTTSNYQNNWGGDSNTAPGTYYYLFKLSDGTSTKGWFEVVK